MRVYWLAGLTALTLLNIGACGGSLDAISGSDDDGGGESDARSDGDGPSIVDGGVVVFDASVEDAGRRHRDGGGFEDGGELEDASATFDGGSFDAGVSTDAGSALDAGTMVDAQAPDGDGGPQGPRDAGTFTGPLLRDGNGVVLGELISVQEQGAVYTIVTSTDYIVDLNFDGTYENNALIFREPACGGTVFLEGGNFPLLGSTVIYCAQRGSLMIPSGPLVNGAEASQSVDFVSAGDETQCDSANGTGNGWPMVETTAANVGLPDTIVPPLSYP